jgi:hypothetical protein
MPHVRSILILLSFMLLASCAGVQPPPTPGELVAPMPREDAEGKFLSPYTSDGVVAGWVEKGISAQVGSTVGAYAGAKLGEKLAEQVPFAGMFSQQIGEAAGRQAAIQLSGGWEAMRESTDLSFDTIDDLIVYTYVNYANNEHYADVIKHVSKIYPDWNKRFSAAIARAPRITGS